mgnify:CR=1 FL=1
MSFSYGLKLPYYDLRWQFYEYLITRNLIQIQYDSTTKLAYEAILSIPHTFFLSTNPCCSVSMRYSELQCVIHEQCMSTSFPPSLFVFRHVQCQPKILN